MTTHVLRLSANAFSGKELSVDQQSTHHFFGSLQNLNTLTSQRSGQPPPLKALRPQPDICTKPASPSPHITSPTKPGIPVRVIFIPFVSSLSFFLVIQTADGPFSERLDLSFFPACGCRPPEFLSVLPLTQQQPPPVPLAYPSFQAFFQTPPPSSTSPEFPFLLIPSASFHHHRSTANRRIVAFAAIRPPSYLHRPTTHSPRELATPVVFCAALGSSSGIEIIHDVHIPTFPPNFQLSASSPYGPMDRCGDRPLGTSTKMCLSPNCTLSMTTGTMGMAFTVCVGPPEATFLLSPKSTQRRFAGLLRRSPTSAQFYHHFFMSRTRGDDAFVLIDRCGQIPSTAIKTCLPSSHPSLQLTSVFSSPRHSAPTPMCLCAACTHCQRTSQRCSCTYPYTFAECPRKTNSAVHIFTVTSHMGSLPSLSVDSS